MADLNSLLIFAKVIEANSFSEAARRLNMPVSTVSRRVADLENQLSVRLLERSTRRLRLTEVGSDILKHAFEGVQLHAAIQGIASDHLSGVTGTLHLSAPPSISDSLLVPLVNQFQQLYPDVDIHIVIRQHFIDHIAEGIDLAFRVGGPRDPGLVRHRIMSYRHQLVASPAYLEQHPAPTVPQELLGHRLLAFSSESPERTWTFCNLNNHDTQSLNFRPQISMNDYAGLAAAIRAGVGIGELPPLVQPELLREGVLVEVMPEWRFLAAEFSVVHLKDRYMPQAVRVFKDFAVKTIPTLFAALPD